MGLYPKQIEEYLALSGIPRGPNSKIFCVDAVHGDDNNAGDRWNQPLATVGAAEDLCTTGHHDVVLLVASTSGANETAAITWDKNLTHLVGLGAPNRIAQRSRIVCNATDLSPFFTISGYGCMFKNLYFWQGQDDVHSLVNVSVTGQRNFFEDVHFAGGGHATQAIDGGASLLLNGAGECLFKNCVFGVDTVASATGFMNMVVDGDAKRDMFEDCLFQLYSDNSGAGFVEIADNAGFDRWLWFKRCLFMNSCTTGAKFPASAIVIPAGMGSVTHRIVLQDCAGLGFTDWDANNRGIVYLSGGTATAGGATGLMQASNST